jgi:hypothetical protein
MRMSRFSVSGVRNSREINAIPVPEASRHPLPPVPPTPSRARWRVFRGIDPKPITQMTGGRPVLPPAPCRPPLCHATCLSVRLSCLSQCPPFSRGTVYADRKARLYASASRESRVSRARSRRRRVYTGNDQVSITSNLGPFALRDGKTPSDRSPTRRVSFSGGGVGGEGREIVEEAPRRVVGFSSMKRAS